MAITAAELLVKVGYDDSDVDSGVKRTESRMGAASVAIGSAVGNLAGNVISQLPGAVMGAVTSMEDAMVPIGTLVGANSAQFKELESGIKQMVSSSPDSPEELGSAAYMILSAGISDSTLALKALTDATDLAGAGMGSTEEATSLITSAMNSFKSEGLDSEKAAKLFFGTIASGKTTTAELAQGFGGIAPLASAAGVSFNDLMAATAAITSTGAPASQAYSGLKGAISAIIKPTADATKTAEELGLAFSQEHLAAVGLPTFLEEVKTATGGNIETMAKLFGGVEGLNTVLALTGPQADAFASNLVNVGVAGENMAERAAETDQTVSAKFATMKNKVMVVLSDLGTKGFGMLFDAWEKYGPAITNIINEVVGGVRALFAAFKAGDGDITSSGFPGFMERVGNIARQVVDTIVANWPRIRDTIVTVITEVQSAVTTIWPTIQAIIQTAVDVLTNNIIPAYQTAFTVISDVVAEVVAMVQEHWPKISEIFTTVAEIIMGVMEVLGIMTQATWDIIAAIWKVAGDEIMAVVGFVFEVLLTIIGTALDVILGVVNTVLSLLKGDWQGAWDAIKGIASDVWDGIKELISLAWDGIKAVVDLAIDGLKSAIGAGWDWIVDQIKGIPDRITSAATGIWDGVKNAFRDMVNWIIGAWNGLEFTLPEVDTHIPGIGKVGGFGIGTPDLPLLAQGGHIMSSGAVMVGERGPELLTLPTGASVIPLGSSAPLMGGGNTYIYNTINMPPGSDGDDVVRALQQYERRNGSVPIRASGN